MAFENNTWTGRLSRYAGVGGALSALGIRLAGNKLFSGDDAESARLIADTLGGLKGPAVKVAQFLSTIPDALPPAYIAAFSTLQSSAPPMGRLFVRRRMAAELGRDWRSLFGDFDEDAAFAASLGQVHRAKLLDGRDVAVKIQYPDMGSLVAADIKQLGIALSLYERWSPALRTQNALDEITERLAEELDYEREARHIALYRHILKNHTDVTLPMVTPDLSTKRVLTLSYLDGTPLKNQLDQSDERRNQMAKTLFRAWYKPLYSYGILHGDPHLGNYTFRPDGGVNILDFGCVRIFPPRFLRGVIELYRAFQTDDQDRAHHAYTLWGFSNLSRDLMAVLNEWARLLYDPLLDDRVRPIQVDGGAHGRETAYRVHQELARLGGVAPPREFVFMDRAAVGIGSVFMHLQAQQNWHHLFESLIQDFDEDALLHRQQGVLAAVGLG